MWKTKYPDLDERAHRLRGAIHASGEAVTVEKVILKLTEELGVTAMDLNSLGVTRALNPDCGLQALIKLKDLRCRIDALICSEITYTR